jgi:hypothetical protein
MSITIIYDQQSFEVLGAQSLVFCVVFWKLLFVIMYFFLLVIVLPVLLFTAPGYSFGIFKLSLLMFKIKIKVGAFIY